MKALFIKDDAAARAMAEAHGLADDMITRAKVREARAIVAQVGLVTASRTGYMLPNGRLEIITCCLFTNFVEGENGWSVWGWTDIRFDFEDLAQVIDKFKRAEIELPQAMGTAEARERIRKAFGDPDNL